MKSDLAFLRIKRIIFHDVPRSRVRESDSSALRLSEVESPITDEIALYLKNRIVNSMASSRSFDIEFDPETSSPVPKHVRTCLQGADPPTFVDVSQNMAKHLYTVQTGSNPAGLLALISGGIDATDAVAILKIEREEGARLDQDEVEGKKTFNILHFRDLILTENTRLFKIALFIGSEDELDAGACDFQRGYTPIKEVADFFLRRFLGCRLAQDPEVQTKRYYDASVEFFNTRLKDQPLELAKCYNHLVSELSSQQGKINPKRFAQDYIAPTLRAAYLEHLAQRGAPAASFELKTALISQRLKKNLYEFACGIKLITPREGAERHLELSELPGGELRAEIRDRLDGVFGK
jgi:hypothetical protein